MNRYNSKPKGTEQAYITCKPMIHSNYLSKEIGNFFKKEI